MLFTGKQTVWTECKTKGQRLENLHRVYSKDIFKDPFKVPTVYMEDKNTSVASSVPIAKRLPPPHGVFVFQDSRLFICRYVHMTTFLFEVFLG